MFVLICVGRPILIIWCVGVIALDKQCGRPQITARDRRVPVSVSFRHAMTSSHVTLLSTDAASCPAEQQTALFLPDDQSVSFTCTIYHG